jgi:hypothetical protein
VLMVLFLGVYMMCQILGIDLLVSVQRKALNRILSKQFCFLFLTNKIIISPQKEVPNDNYWKSSELPQIHYLDIKHPQNTNTFNLLHPYLSLIGINLDFFPRFQSVSVPFSTFYNNLHHHQKQCA